MLFRDLCTFVMSCCYFRPCVYTFFGFVECSRPEARVQQGCSGLPAGCSTFRGAAAFVQRGRCAYTCVDYIYIVMPSRRRRSDGYMLDSWYPNVNRRVVRYRQGEIGFPDPLVIRRSSPPDLTEASPSHSVKAFWGFGIYSDSR